MSDLAQKKCVPCEKGTPPIKGQAIQQLLGDLSGEWVVKDEHHLEKAFTFPNFKKALSFTNCVGKIAEEQGHHPDIYLSWGKVKITLWTHKIDGLSESDFIMAAKCDECIEEVK